MNRKKVTYIEPKADILSYIPENALQLSSPEDGGIEDPGWGFGF